MQNMIYIASSAVPSLTANSIQVMRMCQAFAQLGVSLELLVPWKPHKLFKQPKAYLNVYKYYGVKNIFYIRYLPGQILNVGGFKIDRFTPQVVRYVGNQKSKLIYTRELKIASALATNGIPVAVESHEYENFRDNGSLLSLLKVAHSPYIIKIIVISANLKKLYIEYGFPEAKIIVAHDGVDNEFFNDNKESAVNKQELGIPNRKSLICYAGKMSEDRGIDLLLEVAMLLNNCYFICVGGTAKENKKWRDKIRSKKINNFKIINHVPPNAIPGYLKMADVLVAPYTDRVPHISAISPLKLFEYMALGKPIVISDFPTIREIIKDGYNGILVKPHSIEDLLEGLKRSVKLEAQEIGGRARQTVSKYSWQARAQRILDSFTLNC